jgi:hypothetical protein
VVGEGGAWIATSPRGWDWQVICCCLRLVHEHGVALGRSAQARPGVCGTAAPGGLSGAIRRSARLSATDAD